MSDPQSPLITAERVFLHHRDLLKQHEALQTAHDDLAARFSIMEFFIKEQFPNFFAGEAKTVADPELNPINIVYGEPVEK